MALLVRILFFYLNISTEQIISRRGLTNLGHSILTTDKRATSPTSHTVTLLPFRKAPCEAAKADDMDATFEITAYALLTSGKVEMPLEGVEFSKVWPSDHNVGGIYKVDNLLPGRQYKIRVCYFP